MPRLLKRLRLRGNIVPHREKRRNRCVKNVRQNNALALPPQYTHQDPLSFGPFTCLPPATWRHSGVRVDSRGPSHVFAPPVRHLRHAWARAVLPRGLACRVASVRVLRATSALRSTCPPRILWKLNPLFVILITK